MLHFTSRYKRSKKVSVARNGEARHRGTCTWSIRERGSRVTLVEGTGRPRAQTSDSSGVAHVGGALLGDSCTVASPGPDRPALHAWRLELDGVTVESPSPFAVVMEHET